MNVTAQAEPGFGAVPRWAAWIVASVALAGVLLVLDAPWPWAAAEVLLIPGWVLGGDLWDVVRDRRRGVAKAIVKAHAGKREAAANRRIDPITHKPFYDARATLRGHDTVGARAALAAMDAVDSALVRTRDRRDDGFSGGAYNYDEEGVSLLRYGDPDRIPDFIRRPLAREVVNRVGRTIDDVRLLHNARIERTVLLFTLWGRALLLWLAPLLPLTVAPTPLDDGASIAANGLWLAACLYASALAVRAPALVDFVLQRTQRAQIVRRGLVWIEAPLAFVLAVVFPIWPILTFAAGWTNWWQRNARPPGVEAEFSWPRLAIFVFLVVASQVTGLIVSADVSWAAGVGQVAGGLVAVAIVGGSYGAMLPLSAAVLVQTVVAAARGPRRSRRHVQHEVVRAIDALDAAALELAETQADSTEVDALRRAANDMRLNLVAQERSGGRTPRELNDLVLLALDAVPVAGSETAKTGEKLAREHGRPAPISVFQPVLPDRLRSARVRDRKTARLLRQLLEECLSEARAHGTGAVETKLEWRASEIVLRMENRPLPVRTSGRGSGGRRIADLAEKLGGSTPEHHDPTNGEPPNPKGSYLVEIRLPDSLLEPDGEEARP